jgi:hypothetical protein
MLSGQWTGFWTGTFRGGGRFHTLYGVHKSHNKICLSMMLSILILDSLPACLKLLSTVRPMVKLVKLVNWISDILRTQLRTPFFIPTPELSRYDDVTMSTYVIQASVFPISYH